MIQIKKQIFDTEKKLDLSQFFANLPDGEPAFITMKKISKSDKLKIGLFGNQLKQSEIMKDKMTKDEIEKFFSNINLSDKKTLDEAISLMDINSNLFFDFGVCEDKHSFYIESEGDLKLNSTTFFQTLNNVDMFFYIINKVKEFNSDFLS